MLGQRRQARVVDEDVLLLLLQQAENVAHGVGRLLENVLENRDALEEMLVEGEALVGVGKRNVSCSRRP